MDYAEARRILEQHRLWLDSGRKDGQRADFRGASLHGINAFQNVDLTDADFQGAELRRINFGTSSLRRTNLREADLQNADLKDANFLLTSQLAGADVAGAKLPDPIAEFKGLETIAEATSNAQKLFVAMLGGCLYSWLTIGTTKDAALLTNSASSPLPIIGTALPIVGFYLVAPIVLVALYFYFHLNMQRLWEALADLPAVFPDGRSLDKRADPWLLNGLVGAHFARLRHERPALSRVQQVLSILLAWWVVPITLFVFWGRFLPRHDWLGTSVHVALLAAAIGFGWMSYRLARMTLRGITRRQFLWARAWNDPRTYKRVAAIVGTSVAGVMFYCISLGAIEGVQSYKKGYGMPTSVPERSIAVLPFDNLSDERQDAFFIDGVQDDILTHLAKVVGLKVISRTSVLEYKGRARNLREIAKELGVSHIVEGSVQRLGNRVRVTVELVDARTDTHVWAERYDRDAAAIFEIEGEIAENITSSLKSEMPAEEGAVAEEPPIANVTRLRVLVPRILRMIGLSPFANLIQVDVSTKPDNWTEKTEDYALVKAARLAEAQMQYANARSAFLMNADLFQANLDSANLDRANLDRAKLSHSNLSSVFAPDVKLAYADLENTDLSNAHLENANLFQAKLSNADLSNADLFKANLSRATAWNAKFLRAHLSNANAESADLLNADLFQANLSNATLTNANLENANLSNADLFQANLSNANLSNANLSNASLSNALALNTELSGAILDKAVLAHTDLTRVKGLTRRQLERAITDAKTLLPENVPP